ncbi:hypothetical protein M569_05962, partial [Genlisea aurea]
MGRSLLSHSLILTSSSPRFISTLPNPVHINGLFGAGMKHRWRQLKSGRSFRCLCCTAEISEHSTSEAFCSSVKKRVVSGVQPTGSIHHSNDLGAIKNRIDLQSAYETLFFI